MRVNLGMSRASSRCILGTPVFACLAKFVLLFSKLFTKEGSSLKRFSNLGAQITVPKTGIPVSRSSQMKPCYNQCFRNETLFRSVQVSFQRGRKNANISSAQPNFSAPSVPKNALYTPIFMFYYSVKQFKAVLSSFHTFQNTFRYNFLQRRLQRHFRALRARKPATLAP